jgi:hypothetical protein
MDSPIERIFALKNEAARQGMYGPLTGRPAFVMHAGQSFVDALLMDPSIRWEAIGKVSRDSIVAFGIPIIPKTTGISPNGLRLVFELDG